MQQRRKGLEISKDFKGHYATVLGNMGNMEKYRGNLKKAEQYYSESLTIRQEMKQIGRLAALQRQIGTINVANGKLDKARKCFEDAEAIGKNLQNTHELIYLRRELLHLQLKENNFDGLERALQELLRESKYQKSLMLEIDALVLLVRLHHLKENQVSALEYLQIIIEIESRQNKYYRVYEIYILFLLIGKKIDIERSIKLQSVLSTSDIQLGMSFVEKTEFENIIVNSSAEIQSDQIAKDKFETVYRLLESWGFPQLSISG